MFNFHMMTTVISQVFTEKAGKWQAKNPQRKAVRFRFSLKVDHDKEEGYRTAELVIYGPMNYVGVYSRECWDVIALDDLEWDEDGQENCIKPGKDYQKGRTEWETFCYHDSCWRTDGIEGFFRKYGERIQGFSDSSFYEVIDVPVEIEALS